MRQLHRIVIDDCHIMLNRLYTFRMPQQGKLVAGKDTDSVFNGHVAA